MGAPVRQDIPYCGAAPLPGDLAGAFNLDPLLIAVLGAGMLSGLAVVGRRAPPRRRRALLVGFAVLGIAFLSPLCALSSALFSARVLHHLLLISVAAPLLAMALPAQKPVSGALLPLLVFLQVATVFFWHAPGPYAAALGGDGLYWLMEGTLLGAAFLLWRALLAPAATSLGAGLAHLAIIALMGLLGALITFAPVPLYAAHFLTTAPYGLTALEDQQIAGLLMWVPAMLPNLAAALLGVRRMLEHEPASAGRA